MLKSNYEFEVLVNGHSAKEYYFKGSYYIEGKEGSRFSLRMRNNSPHRVLFVPTVDGLSIMNGKEASYKSRGYIVNAYDATTIDGWRTSDDKVAEFFFSSPKGSYAKRIDKGNNLGVIGCAVFKEKERVIETVYIPITKYVPVYPPYSGPYWGTNYPQWTSGSGTTTMTGGTSGTMITSASSSDSVNCCYSMQSTNTGSASIQTSAAAALGTGFGQEKTSSVVSVDFDKEALPETTFSLYYNTRKALEDQGIEFNKPVYVTPSAFPSEDGYCKRPE